MISIASLRGLLNRRLIRSLYTRTILQLALAILVVFSLMGLVYYGIVTVATQRQETSQLLSSATAIADVVASSYNPLSGELTDLNVYSYVNFTARSTGAIVWVLNQYGELILSTGIPNEVKSQFMANSNGNLTLPPLYRGGTTLGTSGRSFVGDYHGLFKATGQRWISTIVPLPSSSGFYAGEVQLHRQLVTPTFNSFLMANSLLISLLVSFMIALLFIGLLSRNITRPIRLLSQAAERVYQGDLSVRVVLPGINDQGSAASKALVTDDLTVLVNTMNSMIEKMEHQDRDRRDYISSVSHDLRTPITSIKGFIEGMLDGTIPPERSSHYLEIVKQEVLRLQGLVNTLAEASLYESGRQKLNQTVFDINTVIKEDVIGLESLLIAKRISVQTDFLRDDQGRLLVYGDREAISRVVYNIITNAIKFTPEEGIIALSTHRSARPREIEVIIEDSGSGIPESEYPYIFDQFYKVDKSRTAKGSGLGLYICRTILAAHGQRIFAARSDLGGARFIFTLPTP